MVSDIGQRHRQRGDLESSGVDLLNQSRELAKRRGIDILTLPN
jgi:hypothetical protein